MNSNWGMASFLVASTALLTIPDFTSTPQASPQDSIPQNSSVSASFHQPMTTFDTLDLPTETLKPKTFTPLETAYTHCVKRKYAAMVVDAVTGEMIYGCNQDEPRYPASLTKMMTAFLTFEDIENGTLKMDDKLTIRAGYNYKTDYKLATLGVHPGESFTVEQALKGIVTRSAADATVALAERKAGSEAEYVKLMNAKAKELGMEHTHFENSSGAPDTNQVTTARDMVTLERALLQYFPEQCAIFQTRWFSYHKKPVKGHKLHNEPIRNHALIPGADMGKTGYIDSSGYNTVLTFPDEDRRYIVAVFGGRTAGSRNRHALEVLKMAKQIVHADATERPLALTNQTDHFMNLPVKRDYRELKPMEQLANQNVLSLLEPRPLQIATKFALMH